MLVISVETFSISIRKSLHLIMCTIYTNLKVFNMQSFLHNSDMDNGPHTAIKTKTQIRRICVYGPCHSLERRSFTLLLCLLIEANCSPFLNSYLSVSTIPFLITVEAPVKASLPNGCHMYTVASF